MPTFVGVVFAITLVGLQLASSQLSPRVIRTFVRSAVTKTAFGVFLATFAFAVTALAFDRVDDAATASRTVMVAVAMLAVSVAVFVVYVTATMRLLEVGWVITAVANEARATLHRAFPPADTYISAAAPRLVDEPRTVRLPTTDTRGFKGVLGTVLAIDRPRLVRLAAEHECVIELLPRIGEYVPTQAAVFAVHGGSPPDDRRILACLDLGRSRSLYQDPTFGIRQLVDVGTQALSPAINQMTTAVQVIDRLQDLLLRIGRQPVPSGMYTDPHGTVRLVEPTTASSYLLDLAFQEISQCGAASWHVTRRLAAAYADLDAEGIDGWHEPICPAAGVARAAGPGQHARHVAARRGDTSRPPRPRLGRQAVMDVLTGLRGAVRRRCHLRAGTDRRRAHPAPANPAGRPAPHRRDDHRAAGFRDRARTWSCS